MNESFEELIDWLRQNFIFSMAIFLIGMLLVFYFFYIWTQIIPGYRLLNDLLQYKMAAEERLAAADEAQLNQIEAYKTELDAVPEQLSQTGTFLVTNTTADQLVNQLFVYAEKTQVDISNLETKNVPEGEYEHLFSIRKYQVEAVGSFPDLMRFVAQIEELQSPGYLLENVIFNRVDNEETLNMVISIYTSPYGSNTIVLRDSSVRVEQNAVPKIEIPTEPTPTPNPTPTVTLPPPEPVIHLVKRGQTLIAISQIYGVTVDEIKVANNLIGDLIYANQELIIPINY